MSKVAISGNASGTGTFTIQAPNSNTDRVLSLPDEAGTVLTSGGAIDVDASAPADSLNIDSSGNVQVGTTANLGKIVAEGAIVAKATADQSIVSLSHNGSTGVISCSYGATGSYDPLIFATSDAERMRIDSSGKVSVNNTITDNGFICSAGGGTMGSEACYGLARGSYRATLGISSTGDFSLKAYDGEIVVFDSANNATTISPHNFEMIPDGASEDLAWAFYSRNGDTEDDFDNTKFIAVDMTKVVRTVENLTGDKLIYTGTGSVDDGSTVQQDIIQGLIDRIETLEAEVATLKGASA